MTNNEQSPTFGVWQPIETAPKDGRTLLLCMAGFEPTSGHFHVVFCKWATLFNEEYESEEEWKDWFDRNEYNPTHWMPLPPPPVIE